MFCNMNVLLTNDDGVESIGLEVMRRMLERLPGVRVGVVAPDRDRSAVGRGFSGGRDVVGEQLARPGSGPTLALRGTPVDCVRIGALGALPFAPDVIVAGVNHGVNLGDDVAYSGTVAAALEGAVVGLPAIAVSQQSRARELDFRHAPSWEAREFHTAAALVAGLVQQIHALPRALALNVNCPSGAVAGVRVCHLGRRTYAGRLEQSAVDGQRRSYRVLGEVGHRDDDACDFAVLRSGRIAITPLCSGSGDQEVGEALAQLDLAALLPERAISRRP